jgi:hypothetical protein
MNARFVLACASAAVLAAAAAAQAPVNNNCSLPLAVFGGVNPQAPNGASGQTFTNVNATNTVAGLFADCDLFNKDVWFTYTAVRSGTTSVSTCTPTGFTAGTLVDTSLAIYAASACGQGGAAPYLACNDDSSQCGATSLKSYVEFEAFAGQQYLIRVGAISGSAQGTFYISINEPFILANDFCSMPSALVPGVYTNLSFEGTGLSGADSACGIPAAIDVWFTYTAGIFLDNKELVLSATGQADHLAIFTGTNCGSLTPASCVGLQHTLPLISGQTYYIKAAMLPEAAPTSFFYNLDFQINDGPPNDSCGAAYPVTDGTYPKGLADAPYFDNFGATTDPGYPLCVGSASNSDVYFNYVATTSGKVEVSTITPAGKIPGTLTDTVVGVYSACGGTLLACNDDSGFGFLSKLEFDAIQGTGYTIRVGGFGTFNREGTFYLSITPQFSLTLSSPLGVGSFRLKNTKGAPFHAVYNCLTLQQGVYPYGPFFGIEPTLTEIMIQLAYGQAPFLVVLDGAGEYQFDFAGLPPLTVYGVAIEFDPLGSVAGVSNAAVTTIN